jgi:hypothetical protein
MDVCILAFGVMISMFLLGIILGRRHGRAPALVALMGAVLLSLAAALAGYLILNRDLEVKPDSSNEWHKMAVPGGRAVDLQYQSESGLMITTGDGETSAIREIPFCLANGQLARLAPNFVETTNAPYVALPQPPGPFKQQISFNLSYAISTTGLAASSFGIDENGQLWCTESLYKASMGGTGSASLTLSYMTILIFAGSVAVMLIPAAITLEIRRQSKARRAARPQ